MVSRRPVRRVLVYRLGSLGDTIVALPCFHLIARVFPEAERRLLTNIPISSKAASPASVLAESGLVHSFIFYPAGWRQPGALRQLLTSLRRWKPEIIVYLVASRGLVHMARDACFFWASGAKKIIGLPWRRDYRRYRLIAHGGFYESESARLARCLSALGDARLDEPASWDLRLTAEERMRAHALLREWPGKERFIACSVGTKFEVNDWGGRKWKNLLARLGRRHRGLGLLLVGAQEEVAASTEVAADWCGPVINLCGVTAPRETAALLERAVLFLGHDSGPMHLAAAAGIQCVAVFSARNRPGIWFPHGDKHRIIYHRMPCEGCRLERCITFQTQCINSISVDEVYAAAEAALNESSAFSEPAQGDSRLAARL